MYAWEFSGGLARVSNGDKWGYIDRDGNLVIEMKFDDAESFHNGIARVEIDDKYGYIDKTGSYVWEPSN
jgi:hypothetical protein